MKTIGLDVGSTTIKCVVLDENNFVCFCDYQRHRSMTSEMCSELLLKVQSIWPDETIKIAVSGSAGMGIAEKLGLPFVQEVYATCIASRYYVPDTDVVIELGGEDAKILFLSGGFEMRMNGTCAGGTGAFIDQMAALMNITPSELGELAAGHEKVYSIASRCGVFAKSDIQPLLNQGARREDVAEGILYAVVNQTIAGLAQGREINGKILYLGGPLTFIPELVKCFDKTLNVQGTLPENSLYYVAIGAAMSKVAEICNISEAARLIAEGRNDRNFSKCRPLFADQKEYSDFLERHEHSCGKVKNIDNPDNEMFLGIDAGSTTVKAVLCDRQGNMFNPIYRRNNGNPVPVILEYLRDMYSRWPEINICGAAVTGYGEKLIKQAFKADFGVVETIAHFFAAKHFMPDVDFIIDIGGQDIKCFRIVNGAIDSVFLNEACSSGCGSFLQTFAGTLGYSSEEFVRLGLFAKAPVDLGSRCTVFMNSSVKQAQKDGAQISDISAGLAISVVKNALYKVIRCSRPEELGRNIVVQGGTFLNDAVLRAFEQELGREVIRPGSAALMGAYGAALYAMGSTEENTVSTLLDKEDVENFHHETRAAECNGCGNHCHLTINKFSDGEKYIAGNRCDRPLGSASDEYLNLYEFKREMLGKYRGCTKEAGRKTIGIPMGLNMYELLPFWYTFWHSLDFNVEVSPVSDRKLYRKGQHTIPSDTVCYPAKLMHGHIEYLLNADVDAIFYPDMTYNVDEGLGKNHYNCPVVAYYPQVIKNNVPDIKNTVFIDDFIGIHNRKQFAAHITSVVHKYYPDIQAKKIRKAAESAYEEYDLYKEAVRARGREYIQLAKEKHMPVIVLCGRPYHADPEVCHGIDSLICSLGAAVITEDSISYLEKPFPVNVMNQWTYHSRLYAAAKYAAEDEDDDIQIVQLVSFGCGVDAVTTDEVREIVEKGGKIYTQIKIDEISNLGAVTIRLRSLFAAMKMHKKRR